MGHRNTQFNGQMIDMEIEHQGQTYLYEPCILYGNRANFPHPNLPHHIPEHHGTTLFYGAPQYNSVQPQHPAIATSSGHYYPYLPAPSSIRDFPVQVNHGAHDHLSLSSYGRDMRYMDDLRGQFKRKNASAGSSSSATPESELNLMDGGTDLTAMVGSGSHSRNMPCMIGPESVLSHNASPLIQGNFVAPPVQLLGNPWLDNFAWSNLSFVHADMNGACAGAGNIGMQGYPSLPQSQPNPHNRGPPMRGVREYNVNLPSQVATSSRRISTVSSSNAGIQDVVEAGPTFLAPVAPMGFRWYRPQHREIMNDSSARQCTIPHLRVLPEDEVAILEIPGYHEAGNSIDQHREMRLDIDHMSYEELLALGEDIGSVGTGLSEEFVRNNLKITTFTSEAAHLNLEEAICNNQQINFCVICQNNYEDEENIGTLDCRHEYHSECIKKWLFVKNTCPVCKSTALSSKGKYL